MKRVLFIITAVFGLLLACQLTGPAPADGPYSPPATASAPKIGVVDVGVVLSKFDKLIRLGDDSEFDDLRKQQEELKRYIAAWNAALKKERKEPLTDEEKEVLQDTQKPMLIIRRVTERDFRVKEQQRRYETKAAELLKELHAGIRKYALVHGYHMIVLRGDARIDSLVPISVDVDRSPFNVAFTVGGIDITDDVVRYVNCTSGSELKDLPPVRPYRKWATVSMRQVQERCMQMRSFRADLDKAGATLVKQKAEIDNCVLQWQKTFGATGKRADQPIVIGHGRDWLGEYNAKVRQPFEKRKLQIDDHIAATIREFARQNGYDLIFASEPAQPVRWPFDEPQAQQSAAKFSGLVLQNIPDVTEDIVRVLNQPVRPAAKNK